MENILEYLEKHPIKYTILVFITGVSLLIKIIKNKLSKKIA